jgi:Protein of unknown function (DUF4089)
MTDMDDETLDAFIEAGAKAQGLPIDPAWMAAIHANLKVTLSHAAVVGGFILPDEAEAAPVFRASPHG